MAKRDISNAISQLTRTRPIIWAMKIRPVRQSDRTEWLRMREILYQSPDPQEIDDWYAAAKDIGTKDVGNAVLVADRGNSNLAGFVEIGLRSYAEGCEASPVAYLEGWFVDEDVRGKGLGRRLIHAAEKSAIDHGHNEIASDAETSNDISIKAHVALGYEEVERLVCFRKRLR